MINYNKGMIKLTTQEIFKEIKEYQFDKDNILDFILGDNEDKPSFYYLKNMLFNIMEIDTHLENLISFYYKFEIASNIDREITIKEDGEDKKINLSDFLQKQYEIINQALKHFIAGDTTQLREILNHYQILMKDIRAFNNNVETSMEVTSYIESIDSIAREIACKENEILDYQKIIDDELAKLSTKEPISVIKEEGEGINKVTSIIKYPHFRKYHFRKYKKEILNKIHLIESEIKDLYFKKNKTEGDLDCLLVENNLEEFQRVLSDHYRYYDKQVQLNKIFHRILQVPSYYNNFISDLYGSLKVVQEYYNILNEMNNLDLEEILHLIRGSIKNNKLPSNDSSFNDKWDVNVRKQEVKSFAKTTSAEDLPKVMNDMKERYQEIMAMDDNIDFIKQVADFHFDLLKIHPFSDGNGRTSRILLTLMLASRNILIPSLYLSSKAKDDFYFKSDAALKGDYSIIEKELLDRLLHFNPIIIPKEEYDNLQTTQKRI